MKDARIRVGRSSKVERHHIQFEDRSVASKCLMSNPENDGRERFAFGAGAQTAERRQAHRRGRAMTASEALNVRGDRREA